MYSEKKLLHLRQKNAEKNSLRSINLDVTTNCNMSCSHCYAAPIMEKGKSSEVSLSDIENFFNEAYDIGASHYILQGGEAISDKNRLEKILLSLPINETFVNVISNGWEMTMENILWLKHLGVDKICFSLDSGLQEEHDANRKDGSFKRTLSAVDNVLNCGLLTSISTVITHENLNSSGFKNVLLYIKSKKIRLDAQIAIPIGKWAKRLDVLVSCEDADYIAKLRNEYGLLPNGQYYINRDIYNFNGRAHCPAVREFIAVTSDGTIMPCNFCQFSLGNIKDKNLKKLREEYMNFSFFNGKSEICLVGQDRNFIAKYLEPYWDIPKPIEASKIFRDEVQINE